MYRIKSEIVCKNNPGKNNVFQIFSICYKFPKSYNEQIKSYINIVNEKNIDTSHEFPTINIKCSSCHHIINTYSMPFFKSNCVKFYEVETCEFCYDAPVLLNSD